MIDNALVPRPDTPLVSAQEAKQAWREYQELEQAILTDDDYLWFVEYDLWDNTNKKKVRRLTCSTREEAEAEARKRNGRVMGRKIKSACRKLARFFGFEIPEDGTGTIEIKAEGGFLIQVEQGTNYRLTHWMDQDLRTVKASAMIILQSPTGRRWVANGGAHRSEGFAEDFAIAQTAFTRAINRAILDAVGYGDESAEETRAEEVLPGEPAHARPQPQEGVRDAEPGQTPQDVGQLLTWAKAHYGYSRQKVLDLLGVSDPQGIGNLQHAWQQVRYHGDD